MDEPSDLAKAQRQRADALVIASRVLGRKPNLFGPQGVTEDRSTTDLTDLAQFILDGTHPLEGFTATLETTEAPVYGPRLLDTIRDGHGRLRPVEDHDLPESTPGENPGDDDHGPSGE